MMKHLVFKHESCFKMKSKWTFCTNETKKLCCIVVLTKARQKVVLLLKNEDKWDFKIPIRYPHINGKAINDNLTYTNWARWVITIFSEPLIKRSFNGLFSLCQLKLKSPTTNFDGRNTLQNQSSIHIKI